MIQTFGVEIVFETDERQYCCDPPKRYFTKSPSNYKLLRKYVQQEMEKAKVFTSEEETATDNVANIGKITDATKSQKIQSDKITKSQDNKIIKSEPEPKIP